VMREIVYRLLVGEQGDRLQHVAVLDGSTHRIAKAVELLRKGFDQPLRAESIAGSDLDKCFSNQIFRPNS
jgi:hypothetical protein